MEIDYQIIDSMPGLKKIAKILEKEKNLAIDLEADSMYHFKEKVCLIQVATKNRNIVIDPIQLKDLSSLKPLFVRPDIRKIFHGADYDVRSLYRDFNINITHLFDTEVACRFLGLKETGLETVLNAYFNINLDKKYQKKDWSKRPLPQEMIHYAITDVIYLIPLAKILIQELEKMGRLAWVIEECELLSNVRPVGPDDKPLFLKFKGAGRLSSRSLAVLEALLQFRKKIAQKKDKPFFRIIGNQALLKMAIEKPMTLPRLKGSKVLSTKQVNMWGNDIIDIIDHALSLPKNKLPVYPRKKAPIVPAHITHRAKALKKWRDKKAKEIDIDPGLLCNKALISTIATKNPKGKKGLARIQEMKQWQINELGKDIVTVLRHVP
ncbi:MAG: HRDC domain-containing protein [Desulfobacterales bacterium]|nr:MAG: HRDC domain-containing protein [Desulfobacterales bacterium]UCD90335.1 MAG: HRDC domain-containing protein [Desulfobacterales bacterium]